MKSVLTLPLCLAVAFALCGCKPAADTGGAAPLPAQSSSTTMPEAAPLAAPADGESIDYQCADLLIGTLTQSGAMQVSFSGRDINLPYVQSSSGARYEDGKGNVFWNKGEEGTLMLDGKQVGSCSRSDRASPWNEAKSRNIAFRAVGNEPGWYVEVSQGEAPALLAELDYGERTLDIANTKPLSNVVSGFFGIATDGTNVELRIKREACNDGMSGEAFEAAAELVVGDKSYKGCGAFLFD